MDAVPTFYRSLVVCGLLLLAACASTTPPAPVTGGKPRLVVVLIVDGLPQRQVVDYWDQLAPDGLRRFLHPGTWFPPAPPRYPLTHTLPRPPPPPPPPHPPP